MLLQLDKFRKEDAKDGKTAQILHDILSDVKETKQCIGFTQVYFKDGTMKSYARGSDVDDMFVCSQGWLLNDDGKTIRRLF